MNVKNVALSFAIALCIGNFAHAQSGSIGGQKRNELKSEEIQAFGGSSESQSNACGDAKKDAQQRARKLTNVSTSNTGNCNCSTSSKKFKELESSQQLLIRMVQGSIDDDKVITYHSCAVTMTVNY